MGHPRVTFLFTSNLNNIIPCETQVIAMCYEWMTIIVTELKPIVRQNETH